VEIPAAARAHVAIRADYLTHAVYDLKPHTGFINIAVVRPTNAKERKTLNAV
jgi:hypothetical protein